MLLKNMLLGMVRLVGKGCIKAYPVGMMGNRKGSGLIVHIRVFPSRLVKLFFLFFFVFVLVDDGGRFGETPCQTNE